MIENKIDSLKRGLTNQNKMEKLDLFIPIVMCINKWHFEMKTEIWTTRKEFTKTIDKQLNYWNIF